MLGLEKKTKENERHGARTEKEDEINNTAICGATIDSIEQIDVDTAVPEERQCAVCWENESSITFAPCGHQKFCKACALQVLSRVEQDRRCPICQTKIESYILKIYS